MPGADYLSKNNSTKNITIKNKKEMKNRLQFNRHFPIFSGETRTRDGVEVWISGREQAKEWLENKIKRTDFIPLIGEPIVLRYLDKEGKKQLILAVGKATGNTIEQTYQREYHMIDSAELNEGVVEANENAAEALALASAVTKDIANYRVILKNMIDGNGADNGGVELEDGSYFDTDDPSDCGLYKVYPGTNFISAATSLAKADYILDTQLGKTNEAVADLADGLEDVNERVDNVESNLDTLSATVRDFSAGTVSELNRLDDDISELSGATGELSANTKAVTDNIISGAGLDPDGTYEHKHDANYIDDAKTLFEADVLLDENLAGLSATTTEFSANTVSAIAAVSGAAEDKIAELSGAVVANETNIDNLSAGTRSEIDAANDRISALSAGTINEVNNLDNKVNTLSADTEAAIAAAKSEVMEAVDAVDDKVDALSAGTIQLSADTKNAIDAAKAEATAQVAALSGNTVAAINAVDDKVNALSAGTDSRLSDLEAKSIAGGKAIEVTSAANVTTISLKISDSDKVLSQDYYGLKANLTLDYSSADGKIYLRGVNDAVLGEIETNDFIKDGMISAVTLITPTQEWIDAHPEYAYANLHAGTPYLWITFNVDSPNVPKDVFIELDSLVDVYTVDPESRHYMEINDYVISLNVNEDGGLAGYDYAKNISAVTTNIITAAGLNMGEQGGYPGHDETHYIKNATSLDNADVLLDAAIYGAAGQIEALSAGTIQLSADTAAADAQVFASAKTYTDEQIAGVHVDIPGITARTDGTGNVIDSVSVSGTDDHELTFHKNFTAATKSDLDNLSGAVATNKSNIDNLSGAVITNKNNIEALSAGTINLVASSAASVYASANTYADLLFSGVVYPDITVASAGTGNVITWMEADEHTITYHKDATVVTDASFSALSASVVANRDNIVNLSAGTIQLSGDVIDYIDEKVFGDIIPLRTFEIASGSSEEELEILPEDMVSEAFGKIQKQILDNEEATAAGLNDLNEKYEACLSAITENAGVKELSASVVTNKSNIQRIQNSLSSYTTIATTDLLSGAVMSVSALTNHVLTVNLNGVEQGKYCPSADTTLELTAITKVTGADVILEGYEISSGSTEQELTIVPTDSTNDAFGKIAKQVLDNELVTSNALNNLNDRVNVVSGVVDELSLKVVTGVSVNGGNVITPVDGVVRFEISGQTLDNFFDDAEYISSAKTIVFKNDGRVADSVELSNLALQSDLNALSAVAISAITMNGSPVSVQNNVADLGTVITAETQLSSAVTGTGNVFSDISVNGHEITMTKGFNAASQSDLAALSAYTVNNYNKFQTANTLSSLTFNEFLTIVETGADATLSIASSGLPALPTNGVKEAHVIIENTGSTDILITIATDSRIKSSSGMAFGIKAGETGEFNAMITYDGTSYTFYVITT